MTHMLFALRSGASLTGCLGSDDVVESRQLLNADDLVQNRDFLIASEMNVDERSIGFPEDSELSRSARLSR